MLKGRGVQAKTKGFFFLFFFYLKFFFYLDLVYSIVLFPRIEPVGEPYSEVCFNPELWFWMVSQPNSWSKRLGKWIEHFLAYCHNGKKYVGCIELVFKLIMQLADIKEKKKQKKKKNLGVGGIWSRVL